MKHEKRINKQRRRRRYRVRNRLKRDAVRPRLSVFRSHKHIYAQVIDDEAGKTLATASTRDEQIGGQLKSGGNKDAAFNELAKDYRNSYFFYYLYARPGKEK